MFIDEEYLSDVEKEQLKKILLENNFSFVSKDDNEHAYHKMAKTQYLNAAIDMNEYNSVIINLIMLACYGKQKPEFQFTAELEEKEDHKGTYREFTDFTLNISEDHSNEETSTLNGNDFYSYLTFDADPLTTRYDFNVENDYDDFVQLF